MIRIQHQMKFYTLSSYTIYEFDIAQKDRIIKLSDKNIRVAYKNLMFNKFTLNKHRKLKQFMVDGEGAKDNIFVINYKSNHIDADVVKNDELYEICFKISYDILNMLYLYDSYNAANIVLLDNDNQVDTIYRKTHFEFEVYKTSFKQNIINDITQYSSVGDCVKHKGG